ncbi:hypothetical protein O3M35_011907 [Rhynocoris fuscipes]|uniref:Uncharacterized protein n=1 Tax=Rhynocoris fuscipes TaxID=488301 RepID=A0AAW1D366_9HEMI
MISLSLLLLTDITVLFSSPLLKFSSALIHSSQRPRARHLAPDYLRPFLNYLQTLLKVSTLNY